MKKFFLYCAVVIMALILNCQDSGEIRTYPGTGTRYRDVDLQFPLYDGSGTYEISCRWLDIPKYYKCYTMTIAIAEGPDPLKKAELVKTVYDRNQIPGPKPVKLADNLLLRIRFDIGKGDYTLVSLIADGKNLKLPFIQKDYEKGVSADRDNKSVPVYKEFAKYERVFLTITPEVLNALKKVTDLSLVYGETTVKINPKFVRQLRSYAIDIAGLNYIKCDEKVNQTLNK